jgi:hypothetical protein
MDVLRGTAPAMALAVLMTVASAAFAVVPPQGTYSGISEQQGSFPHDVTVRVDAQHQVTRVHIDWRAPCKRAGRHWSGGTRVLNPEQHGGKFHDHGSYDSATEDGQFKAHITETLDGHFPDKRHAAGRFTAKVDVKRAASGKKVDSCRVSTKWHATR